MKLVTANLNGFTQQQSEALIWTSVSLMVVYMVVLSGLLYNIYYYLYKERFSKIIGVSLFYIFTVATVILRITGYIDLLLLSNSRNVNAILQTYWQVSTLAAMFMIAVGVQIAKNMYELAILLKFEPDDAVAKFKILNPCSYVAFTLVLLLEIYLCISTSRTTPQSEATLTDISFKKRTYSVLLCFYLLVSCLLISGYIYMFRILSKFNAQMLKR